ncbi:unnamed protein product, partial [Protopolystoma xenopodis]
MRRKKMEEAPAIPQTTELLYSTLLQRLDEQEGKQNFIIQGLRSLSERLDAQQSEIPEGSTSSVTPGNRDFSHDPKIPFPDKFSGDRGKFFVFQEACKLYLSFFPHNFPTGEDEVRFVMTLLQGDPQVWALRLPSSDPARLSLEAFFATMAMLYDDPDRASSADSAIRKLRQ